MSVLFAAMLCWLTGARAMAADPLDVWLSPDPESPDFVDLFSHPEAWPKARGLVKVLKFGPTQVELQAHGPNSFAELKSVDAFRKIRGWGMKIAVEEGAVKEWDCTGRLAAQVTVRHMRNLASAGAGLDVVAMDEPMSAGTRLCKLPLEQIAANTAAYAKAVQNSDVARQQGGPPAIGDIEAYPSTSAETIRQFVLALKQQGFTPAFVHLDIAAHYLSIHPEIDMSRDLRMLNDFLRQQNIPLGILFWSGVDPLSTDQQYYEHAMALVRSVKAAIGRPDQSVFQSWIVRSRPGCEAFSGTCASKQCKPSDGPLCGHNSIPVNLPESGPNVYSHTRLVNDGMALLGGR
jgi:hypothetical protein